MIGILVILVLGFAGGAVAHAFLGNKFAADLAWVKAELFNAKSDLAALKAKLP